MIQYATEYKDAWQKGLRTHYSEYGDIMTISLEDLKEMKKGVIPRYADDESLLVAIKLKEGVEMPLGVTVHMRISKQISTAKITGQVYYQLLDNPDVISVEVSKQVPIFSE
jgi:hypothetical protein